MIIVLFFIFMKSIKRIPYSCILAIRASVDIIVKKLNIEDNKRESWFFSKKIF